MSPDKPNPELWRKDALPWIEKVVAEALAKARSREEIAELGPSPDILARQLDGMTKRLHDFAAFASAPKPVIAAIDEQFREGEAELRQFLADIEAIRGRLQKTNEL